MKVRDYGTKTDIGCVSYDGCARAKTVQCRVTSLASRHGVYSKEDLYITL